MKIIEACTFIKLHWNVLANGTIYHSSYR